MKYSYSDIYNECTFKQYIDQYNPIKLELGKSYIQSKDTWHEKHYVILFIDDKIAIGKSIYNKIGDKFIGDYDLFYLDNGFKYNDTVRPCYRLTEEIKK